MASEKNRRKGHANGVQNGTIEPDRSFLELMITQPQAADQSSSKLKERQYAQYAFLMAVGNKLKGF